MVLSSEKALYLTYPQKEWRLDIATIKTAPVPMPYDMLGLWFLDEELSEFIAQNYM